MQINTIMRHPFAHTEITLEIKMTANTHVDEEVGKLEPSHSAGDNVILCSLFRKLSGSSSKC